MNIIVIGLGSMGKRRIRLLSENKNIKIFGIDSQQNRCQEVTDLYGIECFNSIDDACKAHQIDAAVISTSPLSHASIIRDCLNHNLHVFTELNLVADAYEDNIQLAKEKNRVLFLSSTFLYRDELKYIIENTRNSQKPLNYVYHVGQYLPDWHPWESYKDYFIGDSRTNGCREIMAIELPWLVTAFGDIKEMTVMKSKNSALNIDYNDNYMIMLKHQSGAKGMLAVDVVTRKPHRKFHVYGEDILLTWDGTPDSLTRYDINEKIDKPVLFKNANEHTDGYASFITENPYREELNAFIHQIEDSSYTPQWDFERDKIVLDWIDKIED